MSEGIKENIESFGKKFIVYGDGIGDRLGYADSFGECKKMHREWLEKSNHENKDNYAGLACDGGYLKEGMAFPTFYE